MEYSFIAISPKSTLGQIVLFQSFTKDYYLLFETIQLCANYLYYIRILGK